jgi:hypothetical protein
VTEPKITVTGIEETNAALAAFGDRAANDLEIAGQAAAIVAAAAGAGAPVRTGALAAGYGVVERYVNNPVEYAPFVEFGTDRMVPQYVITNAMEASTEQVAAMYAEWLANQAQQVGFESKSEQ